MNILILCKVVDNYGDMGFAYRLALSLADLAPQIQISLVMSNLPAFAPLTEPPVDANLPDQRCGAFRLLDWNDGDVCRRACEEAFPDVVLECFQCGRPEWLEDLLFGGRLKELGRTVRVVNIEYLTAEDWADDFHLLKSGTRFPCVKKVNFMPGFTDKTGGLLLDKAFMAGLKHRTAFPSALASWLSKEDCADLGSEGCFSVLVFSYSRDFSSIIMALKEYSMVRKVHVFAAAGAGRDSFIEAFRRAGEPFALTLLPFLPQKLWDSLLLQFDFAFVRGEDSFSRMCLSGTPFVWQAYPQDGQFHLVKVRAFLERLHRHLPEDAFTLLAAAFMQYNREPSLPLSSDAADALAALPLSGLSGVELWLRLFSCAAGLREGFAAFSRELIGNGDLAAHILAALSA